MTQIQTLTDGGTLARLTDTTAVATGTIAEIQAVLDAAEKSHRLDGHGELVPVANEAGVFLVNVQLRPIAVAPRRPAPKPIVRSQEVVILPRHLEPGRGRLVGVQRRTKAVIAVTAGAGLVLGVASFTVVEILEFVASYFAYIVGSIATVALALWLLSRSGGDGGSCSGVHVRH